MSSLIKILYNSYFSPFLVKEVSVEECEEIENLLQYLSEEHTKVKMKKQVMLLKMS